MSSVIKVEAAREAASRASARSRFVEKPGSTRSCREASAAAQADACTAGEQVKPALETGEDLIPRQNLDSRGGELEGERQSVEL